MIVDPTGTVGALGAWANQASLGTLAVAAERLAGRPGRRSADSMEAVFAAAIEVPWCYLEFGDVGWCENRRGSIPRLRAAGLKIAAAELALIGCRPTRWPRCPACAAGSAQAQALEHSAELLRDARQQRRDLPRAARQRAGAQLDQRTKARCCGRSVQSSEATDCRGPTAAQAEFRTNGGTWSRVGGLLLIVGGAARHGAAARFHRAAPAGRGDLQPAVSAARPRRWCWPRRSARAGGGLPPLGGAAAGGGGLEARCSRSCWAWCSRSLRDPREPATALGWWTQWLLMSAFWWGAYARRHQALGVARGGRAASAHEPRRSRGASATRWSLRGESLARARWAKSSSPSRPPTSSSGRRARAAAGARRLRDGAGEQELEREHREAATRARAGARALSGSCPRGARSSSACERERGKALAAGTRGARTNWRHRRARIEAEVGAAQRTLAGGAASRASASGSRRGASGAYTPSKLQARAASSTRRRLWRRAPEPGGGRAPEQRRDYAALAGLAGLAGPSTNALDPRASARPDSRSTASWRCAGELRRPLRWRCRQGQSTARTRASGRSTGARRRRSSGACGTRPPHAGLAAGVSPLSAARDARRRRESRRASETRDAGRAAVAERANAARRRQRLSGRVVGCVGAVPASALVSRWSRRRRAGAALARGVAASSGVGAAGAGAGPCEASSALAQRKSRRCICASIGGGCDATGCDWAVLAGIGKVECDHGRDPDPSCTAEGAVNSAGAGGPMQFLASTWARYGVDGDGDGRVDRWDPADAIYAAANYLRASGAPGDYQRGDLRLQPRQLVRRRGGALGARGTRAGGDRRPRVQRRSGRRGGPSRWRRERRRRFASSPGERARARPRRRPRRAGPRRGAGGRAGDGRGGQRAAGPALRPGRPSGPARAPPKRTARAPSTTSSTGPACDRSRKSSATTRSPRTTSAGGRRARGGG